MITKKVKVFLNKEELDSPEPITIELEVTNGEDSITYHIDYPKGEEG